MLLISPKEKKMQERRRINQTNVWSHRASDRAINTKESLLNSIDKTQVWKTARPISTDGRVKQSKSCSGVILLLNNWIVKDWGKSQSFFLIQTHKNGFHPLLHKEEIQNSSICKQMLAAQSIYIHTPVLWNQKESKKHLWYLTSE